MRSTSLSTMPLVAALATIAAASSLVQITGCDEGIRVEEPEIEPDVRPPPPNPCQAEAPPPWCTPSVDDAGLACFGGAADGACDPRHEGCDCSDCGEAALCRGACVDDGACALSQGEDCSCADCNLHVAACAPKPRGCKDDGVCSPVSDDCTCPDCASEPSCQACFDNGECVPFLEGCQCGDCAGTPLCEGDAGLPPAP